MSYKTKIIALGLVAGFGASLTPGCVLQIGTGGSGDSAGSDPGATTGAGSGGGSDTTGGSGGSGGGADAFAGIDPEELNRASLKASALSYNMFGLVNSSGLDPSTVDQATLDALMQQLAPTAEATVNTWLSSLSSSTIPTAGNQPDWECTDKLKCPYVRKCLNAPYSGIVHNCWVNTCGSAKCNSCPDWFPEEVKNVFLDSWCAYVCTDQGYPQKTVAIGVGGVTRFKDTPYPAAGVYCFAP